MEDLMELWTADQVAEHYNHQQDPSDPAITPRQVHYARRVGKLNAVKLGWVWVFPKTDLPQHWPIRQKRKTA